MTKKSSIVIGSNGYIGRHLVHGLLSQGYKVFPFDTQSASKDNLNNYRTLDISDASEVRTLPRDVDYLFVMAGLTGTKISFDRYDKFIQVNELGLLNVLDHCVKSGSKARIIFPSTRLVYKGLQNTPLSESGVKEPKTIYAQNKIACESFLDMYSQLYDIDFTIFRICVPYGSNFETYSYGTIGYFLNRAMNKQDISLYGYGSLKRTFTHIEDIVQRMLDTIRSENSINQIFNIGGHVYELKDVATLVAQKYGVNITYQNWPEDALKIESGDTIFDSSKIDKLLNQFEYKDLSTYFQ